MRDAAQVRVQSTAAPTAATRVRPNRRIQMPRGPVCFRLAARVIQVEGFYADRRSAFRTADLRSAIPFNFIDAGH